MIRLVRASRLAALEAETDRWRERATIVQQGADRALSRYLAEAEELVAQRDRARCEAGGLGARVDALTEDAAAFRRLAEAITTTMSDPREWDGDGPDEAGRLIAYFRSLVRALSKPGPERLWVLFRHGKLHSVHASEENAKAYAAARGVPREGWTPSASTPLKDPAAWSLQAVDAPGRRAAE